MVKARITACLIVIGMMLAAGVALELQPEGSVADASAVRLELPDKVGDYVGTDLWFCQNEMCLKTFIASEPAGTNCPVCGSELDSVSFAEKRSLPADTVILRKRYTGPGNRVMTVSVVFSGKEQKSIHRPQQCLPALGYIIERARSVSVSLQDKTPFKVMLLDIRGADAVGGRSSVGLMAYAYWFAGGHRETPYHLERLLWMSADRLFRNVVNRWAYIAVSTDRTFDSDEHIGMICDFIHDLHPLIMTDSPAQGTATY